MKKTIIISAMALCFSIVTVNANSFNTPVDNYEATAVFKVSPFCVSIAKGDIETVKKLINLGADVNEKSNGMTPVMYAAKFNRTDILKLLISKGAKLKVRSEKGMTALKYAEIHKATDAYAVLKEAMSKKKKNS
ncbi:ankyrin repeat domain-containing protein [uncultured Algibacter sp.]|uniref:ankyrin repeat domain-containing protein n=1 Tax=uncultured Algibacter sp. TaxID=298659 RepID=UPI0026292BC6|nr:ankyrin repeat domain-containing protein [uncultured Algibacter sp.]